MATSKDAEDLLKEHAKQHNHPFPGAEDSTENRLREVFMIMGLCPEMSELEARVLIGLQNKAVQTFLNEGLTKPQVVKRMQNPITQLQLMQASKHILKSNGAAIRDEFATYNARPDVIAARAKIANEAASSEKKGQDHAN